MISGDGVMMGYAFPVRVEAVFTAPDVPYVGLLKALDAVGPDQVYVTPSNRNIMFDHLIPRINIKGRGFYSKYFKT